MLWTPKTRYVPEEFQKEADLEAAIREVGSALFGPRRIYLDVKKRIGAKGRTSSIPDGYLIDLSSRKKPNLYVVEVELMKHDPLKHVAVQILEFSLAFEAEPQKVKKAIREALDAQTQARSACERFAAENGFENLDFLLETLVYEGQFSALVIIDELSSELEAVLMSRFKFPVEVITLRRYVNQAGERIYEFEPFLEGVPGYDSTEAELQASTLDPSDIDTVVVPARDDGFQEVFLGEDRWYAVRIHSSMIPHIKYAAAYRVAPISAITHVAPVASIDQWRDTNKRVIVFSEPAREIGPIPLVKKGSVKAPQSLRYTSMAKLAKARNLDEVF